MNSNTTTIKEYEDTLKLLADNESLVYFYALKETIRLMENLVSRPKEEIEDRKVIDFTIKAAKYLSDYEWNHYDSSTIAQLELFLHAMSSVLHILSQSVSMISSETRTSLYKSVSKFWAIYRNTKFINANIMFSLREIRTCLRKIKDDKSNADHALRIGGNFFDVVVSVAQKEYLAALGSFIKVLDFEYSTGEWYYDWKDTRENYFTLRQQSLENDDELRKFKKFYKKLLKLSTKEFERVKRKNTKYRNFEYKMLKSGGQVMGCSLPDNIDNLLIGYLHLIQRILEEYFPRIKKYIKKTIPFCNEIIETHAKKQLTFKAAEILYVIKQNSKNEEIKDKIELNFKNWTNFSNSTLLGAPILLEEKQNRRLSIREIPKKLTTSSNVQNDSQQQRKNIIENVTKLFEERYKINKNIDEIKAEHSNLLDDNVDENSILSKLKEMFENLKGSDEAVVRNIETVKYVKEINIIKVNEIEVANIEDKVEVTSNIEANENVEVINNIETNEKIEIIDNNIEVQVANNIEAANEKVEVINDIEVNEKVEITNNFETNEEVEVINNIETNEKIVVNNVEANEEVEVISNIETNEEIEEIDNIEAANEEVEVINDTEVDEKVEVSNIEANENVEVINNIETNKKIEEIDNIEANEEVEVINDTEVDEKIEVNNIEANENVEVINNIETNKKIEEIDNIEAAKEEVEVINDTEVDEKVEVNNIEANENVEVINNIETNKKIEEIDNIEAANEEVEVINDTEVDEKVEVNNIEANMDDQPPPYDEYDIDVLNTLKKSLPSPYNEYDIDMLKNLLPSNYKKLDSVTIINIVQNNIPQQDNNQDARESSFFATFKNIIKEVENLVEKASKAHQAAIDNEKARRLSNNSNQPILIDEKEKETLTSILSSETQLEQ